MAQTRDSDDLAAGIHWILTNKEIAGKEGRKFVETHYSEEIIAQKHVEYYLKSMQDVCPN